MVKGDAGNMERNYFNITFTYFKIFWTIKLLQDQYISAGFGFIWTIRIKKKRVG